MKLANEDILEIARMIDEGNSRNKIATKFNLNKATVHRLMARYKLHGINAILHSKQQQYTNEEKIAVINKYYQGRSKSSLAIEMNVSIAVISQWVSKYEKLGYNGLIDNRGRPGVTRMGRPRKKSKIEQPTSSNEAMAPLTDEERQELNELRKKTYYQQMEIDCLKKIQALVQQRQNRQTKKK